MKTKKIRVIAPSKARDLTPETTPYASPAISAVELDSDHSMSEEDLRRARPVNMQVPRDGVMSHAGGRPRLDDVLNDRAPTPYTLDSYKAYLDSQHCSEVLDFTLAAKEYRVAYEKLKETLGEGKKVTSESNDGFNLEQDWITILEVYIKPGAAREINLPAEERDDVVDYSFADELPPPEALDPSVKRMHELMGDSIFIPWCNSLAPAYASTYSVAPASLGSALHGLDPSRSTFDDRGADHHEQNTAPARQRSLKPSALEFSRLSQPPASHRYTQSSTLSSSIERSRSANNRLSAHVSNSSAVSAGAESALTDDSSNTDSPAGGDRELMTPPTTPPSSDAGLHHSTSGRSSHGPTSGGQGSSSSTSNSNAPKPYRSDSGSWKKMGTKLWGKKKNGGILRERPDET